MLRKLKIQNFFSIYDEVEIDLTKGNYAYKNNMMLNDLVNPIGIYGLNGSGKTTLVNAIYSISRLMYQSISTDEPVFIPNMLDKNSEVEDFNMISKFSFELKIDNVNIRYNINIMSLGGIVYESLINLDSNEKYFERTEDKYIRESEEKEQSINGRFYPVLRLIGKEELNNKSIISKVFDFFNNIVYINSDGDVLSDYTEKTNIMDLVVQKSSEIKNVIKQYGDFPVYDILQEEKSKLSKTTYIKMEGSKNFLPYLWASNGIKTHNKMIAMLLTMPKNSLILVDELERNLHPLIAQKVIERMNVLSIQMLFTSHNTNLLQKLRPDQIIFARWEENESVYNKLSKIYPNIREVNNIEKMYFGGLFDEAE